MVSNPFATRYVASARIAARDESGRPRDLTELAERLARNGGRGAIVGPHGAGKSTLLRQLADLLESRAIPVRVLRVRRWLELPDVIAGVGSIARGGVACIDGWEVLGGAGRLAVRAVARIRGVGVVVTAHRRGWPATLLECRTSEALLRGIVGSLPGREAWFGRVIDDGDLAECFAAGSGDLRRSLDLLYDRFERRGRSGMAGLCRPEDAT